jgi:hypothetical protein
LHLRWLFAVQAVLLTVAAWRNLHQLNPDAIAYIRIAGYYATGQVDLAVTGYWGPLLSWLMVPLLNVGAAPLVAARVVMAVSGVVFLCGAVSVFRAFRLPRVALLTGAWIAMGWSVFWSVRHITPDLLMAGLVALAVSATVKAVLTLDDLLNAETLRARRDAEAEAKPDNSSSSANLRALRASALTRKLPANQAGRRAIAAGMWWGLAYLAKAVALPLAVLTTAGLAMFALSGRGELRRVLAQRLGLIWLCTALVAAPWMAVLSLHYGKFTFSTTGPIAHALAGPGEGSRYHPAMVTLHQPDAGRVTQWEEPSRMAYRHWSPLGSWQNLLHQHTVISANLGILWNWLSPCDAWLNGTGLPAWRRWLGTFDLLGWSGIAVMLGGFAFVTNCQRLRRQRSCWALVPLLTVGGLYLPFFVMAEDNRYFYPALPFLWVLAWGGDGTRPRHSREELHRKLRRWGFRVLIGSFAIPVVLWCGASLRGLPNPASHTAHELATQLKSSGRVGPIAGSGLLPGGRTGLYTAFLLGERWLGDDAQAGPEAFAAAGARVVVLRRDAQQRTAFERAPGWRAGEPAASVPLLLFVRENP